MLSPFAIAVLATAVQAAKPAPVAAPPRETLVVSTSWLAQHLKDPDLVLLHVGDKAEYEVAHIPGARFVSLPDISVSDRTGTGNGLVLEMPPADDLQKRLAALGVSDNSRIVVYFGKDWVSPTTRVVFTLDYAGLGGRTSLLDGGQPAWVRDGHAVTTAVPEPKTGALQPLRIRPLVATRDFVREHVGKPGYAIVDSRNAEFYTGAQSGGGRQPHKTGHIAGALSVPFSETTEENLGLKSPEKLKALFENAGVKPGDTVVTYCHIGQQATATLFAARTLGYNVMLYDGSFEDWSRVPELPVATTPTKK